MTCASCAARIEKQAQQARRRDGRGELRHREGARVDCPATRRPQATLIAQVEAAGYTARALPSRRAAADAGPLAARLRRRLIVAPCSRCR